MVVVKVCVGSSCYIKGAPDIVEMMEKKVRDGNLDGEVVLVGSFCAGKCNRVGVTVTVDDDVFTGITKENFENFWTDNVMSLSLIHI